MSITTICGSRAIRNLATAVDRAASITLVAIAANLAHAQAPLTHCTDPGGVLSNGNTTCTFTVTMAGDSVNVDDPNNYISLAGSLRANRGAVVFYSNSDAQTALYVRVGTQCAPGSSSASGFDIDGFNSVPCTFASPDNRVAAAGATR